MSSHSNTLSHGRYKMRPELPQIRRNTAAAGVSVAHVTDFCLERVLVLCKNDPDLAVDSLTMSPRPSWVAQFCGERVETLFAADKPPWEETA